MQLPFFFCQITPEEQITIDAQIKAAEQRQLATEAVKLARRRREAEEDAARAEAESSMAAAAAVAPMLPSAAHPAQAAATRAG